MKNIVKLFTVLLVITFNLNAQDYIYGGLQGTSWGVGLSAKKDITREITAQGIITFGGILNQYSVRGLYKFQQKKDYNLYGYGSLGLWSWGGLGSLSSENTVAFGAGAGLEYDLRKFLGQDLPLFWNIELGVAFASFSNYTVSSPLLISGGLHYRF